MLEGFTASLPEATAVPLSVKVADERITLLAKTTLPCEVPPFRGEYTTLTSVLWPGARRSGSFWPVIVKSVWLICARVRVTGERELLTIVLVRVTEVPTGTEPK